MMNRRVQNIKQDGGFTILELMIAMVISSLILAACTAAFVQVSRMYYRGYVQAKTQELTRQTIDDITKPIQFSGETPKQANSSFSGVTVEALCVSGRRYSYVKGYQLYDFPAASTGVDTINKRIRHALWLDSINSSLGCAPLDITKVDPGTDALSDTAFTARELLMPYARLSELKVDNVTSNPINPEIFKVSLAITYGDVDLLVCSPGDIPCSDPTADITTATCKGGIFGSQFCARSQLSTVVSRRLK